MADSSPKPSPRRPSPRRPSPRRAQEPSAAYKLVATPLLLVSFVVSLALVETRHSLARLRAHADAPSRLPRWLRALRFGPQPYGGGGAEPRRPWHYHSNQRKLMALEAAEAFEIRRAVLVVLAVAAVAAAAVACYLARTLFRLLVGARA